ncbi:HslU--HslV peptidase proteolytic subunit [Candidatus Desantisbacteria bacterium CG2_30_40_21]|uniref:ATP-dependent protease subunit HslV n=5 Tax=unclassified Candidatus Desantisiibacteriota TaxID=3106372 RepID=A0A2M7JCV4_9BACT|nr:MAG: HslU--HslV peptidase proteolytic subunit [Candidatus Desantisbacteria bacterium CG2_30_40_21]PIP41613.1 MAG: HslU--HslV peptidase proteolytic subunit [Candidatus Desantisbacteria bacterium CG23_combo_of_CG06-09_8_20_14_all_40_23]PIX17214.1 MAG: HslU--HslV peptidase proteolytic subunit [Candidatus Desantisbacteria bacterium CG_4_8_14_3_um_filter_40_12]PIY19857.1 MAG: HslU--HslV peptidase proteolytic subunit [Candidatus Desantisbacteria bacterium CG_4_10_14_3_um_filter_40_18]PJB29814.1 MA
MIHATTILGVSRNDQIAIGGDGQVSLNQTIMKSGAKKVRRMYKDKVLAGFAGSAADAFTLFERFETKLEEYHGNLSRAAVELAKEWRTDKYLRKLEALLAVIDKKNAFIISGSGEVIEPDDGVVAIGSGGVYALAAARALISHTDMNSEQIVRESLLIASRICVYTNDQITVETLA